MPSPWKNAMTTAVSRLAAGLRTPENGGALPVQTGFPTSLADLFLNHRGRLRKKPSSSRRKTKPSLDSGAGACKDLCASSVGTPSAEIDGVREKVPSLALPIPTLMRKNGSVAEFGLPAVESTSGRVGDGVVEEIETQTPSSTRTNPTQIKNGCSGLLMAKLYVLVALTIARRKLVAGVTILAFVFMLLDLVGFRVFEFLKPCPKARGRLNSVITGLDLAGRGSVSPIREVGVESRMDPVESEQSCQESSVDSDQETEVLLERRDVDGVEKVCRGRTGGSSGNSKAKKLLKKLASKKFRRRKDGKNGKDFVSDSSREVSNSIREEQKQEQQIDTENVKEEQKQEEQIDTENVKEESEEVLRFSVPNEIANFDVEDVEVNQETLNETKSGRAQKLVLFILVLVGLVGGKAAALVLTVSSWLFIKLIETVRKK